jgi:hypothetical protein
VQAFVDYLAEDPVAIRNEDWPAIHRAIADAISPLKPRGWRKALFLGRELGIVGAVATVIVALLALAAGAFYQATARATEDAKFRTRSEDRLTAIEGTIAKINATLEGMTLNRIGSDPANPESIKEARNVITAAAANRTKIDPIIVKDVGTKFIQAGLNNPDAWNTALAFVNYRSTLNVYVRPVKTVSVPAGAGTNYDLGPRVDGKPSPQGSHIPIPVAAKDAARFETIGKNLNQQLQYGSAQLILTGGALSLDDRYVRHIVFQGVEIHYSGRPLILEDAIFTNCTFVLDNTPTGRQLGEALLASSPISFKTTV